MIVTTSRQPSRLLLLSFIITLCLITAGSSVLKPTFPAQAADDHLKLDAKAAVLIEAETGRILYDKEGNSPLPPASITKNMTLLLIFEAIKKGQIQWDEKVTVSQTAWEMTGSEMFLEIGQEVSIRDLVKGITVASANDACVAIAEHMYGSEANFVHQMNERAQELGLENTNFMNSSGLPHPDHFMSAMDIANLSRYLVLNYPEILEFLSQQEFTFNEIKQYNRNHLLAEYPGADGLKTGHTQEAGYCLDGTAVQNDMRLIAVILNSPTKTTRKNDIKTLLDYGFHNYELINLFNEKDVVTTANVLHGKLQKIPLIPQRKVKAVIPIGQENQLKQEISLNKSITAPVEKNTPLGTLTLTFKKQIINRVPLVAGKKVEKANFMVIIFRQLSQSIINLGHKILTFFTNMINGLNLFNRS